MIETVQSTFGTRIKINGNGRIKSRYKKGIFDIRIKSEQHALYLLNGGMIKESSLYYKVLRTIFVLIIRSVLQKGVRINIPFIGYIQAGRYTDEKLLNKKRMEITDNYERLFFFKYKIPSGDKLSLYNCMVFNSKNQSVDPNLKVLSFTKLGQKRLLGLKEKNVTYKKVKT